LKPSEEAWPGMLRESEGMEVAYWLLILTFLLDEIKIRKQGSGGSKMKLNKTMIWWWL
jgi:hypothetical protein